MAKQIIIRNNKTETEYTVSEAGWEAIVQKGMASRFTIVREQVTLSNAKTFMPPEIKQAATKDAATKEQPSEPKRSGNPK